MEQSLNPQQSASEQASTEQVYRSWRERFVVPLLIGTLIFGAIALLPALSASGSWVINAVFIIVYSLVLITTVFRFSYTIRITVFLACTYALALVELFSLGILGDSLFFFLGFIVFATMLVSPRAGIAAIILAIITFIIIGWLMLYNQFPTIIPNATPSKIEDWISASAALVMFGTVIIIGFQELGKEFTEVQVRVSSTLTALSEERNNLESRVQERTAQFRRINEVERAVAAIIDISEILPLSVKFIQNEFGFYYTSVYMIDSTGQWAELKEAAGEAGRLMKEKKHRISINGRSTVAHVIRFKTGQIVQDVNQIRLENPMFPYTRSMIVVPLIVGDTVMGVLEMHSSVENEFPSQDLDAYQNMANGIASAIENARLFQEAQQSIAEMRATQRQYLASAWSTLASEKSLNYALGDVELAQDNPIEVQLALRNQTIGQILAAGATEWTNEQKNLVEAIAVQATLALENARLVENSQFTAEQERLTNEIISKIWASPNMDSILQTAVRELGRNLEASEVEIEVSMEGMNDE
jgi:GAF domain-containing protein